MAELVSVADGLYAQDDYSFLPSTVRAWGGYVGKPSINAWTAPQVAHLEGTGRLWLPIWTPGDGTTYTKAEATADAAAMLAGLSRLGIHDQRWVFLDIEHSRWVNTPAQTEQAAGYWCGLMRASGWPRAGWYGPLGSTAPWLAHWTGVPPVSLPPGVLGIQYDHALAGDRYDISGFDPSILEVGDMALTQADVEMVWDGIVDTGLTGATPGVAGHRLAYIDERVNALTAAVAALTEQVSKLSTGTAPASYVGTATVKLTPGP